MVKAWTKEEAKAQAEKVFYGPGYEMEVLKLAPKSGHIISVNKGPVLVATGGGRSYQEALANARCTYDPLGI